jgi:putative acetyltransferase
MSDATPHGRRDPTSDAATVRLRPEQPGDAAAIRQIHRLAFEGEVEAEIVDAIRAAEAAVLSLVAEEAVGGGAAETGVGGGAADGHLVGHVLFTSATVTTADGYEMGLLSLAPVGVLPSWQGRGIGTMLIESGLEQLRAEGHPAVVVLGHPSYYPRFGFVPASSFGLRWEMDAPDEAFMALELSTGALAEVRGVIRFRPEFEGA